MIKNEFIIAHRDLSFPIDQQKTEFFTSVFKPIEDCDWQENSSAQFAEEEFWTQLELERFDDTGAALTRVVIDVVRKQNYPASFLFSSLSAEQFVQQLEQGMFKPYQAFFSSDDFAFTSITIESEDSRERKEFIHLVNRFLDFTNGIILYPEPMNASEFKSFYSLVADKVVEDVEPLESEE